VRPNDLTDVETEILFDWWSEAARHDPHVLPPDARTLARTPTGVQAALRALSGSRFFAGIAQRAMLGDLRQLTRYFAEPELRTAARERVCRVVGDDTRVVVGHSLGSVVAYEAICAHPEWRVHTFVTLGSPLGIRNLVFENLDPRPASASERATDVGAWPGSVTCWVNISDEGDVVALVKDLRPAFDRRIENHLVHNGAHAHDVRPYLTSIEAGHAVRSGLRHE
jgi:pimeloyl-ACP methyl ester carboxylesterase